MHDNRLREGLRQISPDGDILLLQIQVKEEASMFKTLFAAVLFLVLVTGMSEPSTLYVGNDTNTPVSVYLSNGTFIGPFGQNFATGSAIDAAGNVWTVAPSFSATTMLWNTTNPRMC